MSTDAALKAIRKHRPNAQANVGFILGSGLGSMADAVAGTAIDYAELPGFPRAGVSGHSSKLVIGKLEGIDVAVLGGREHYYENGRADAMRVPLEVLISRRMRTKRQNSSR